MGENLENLSYVRISTPMHLELDINDDDADIGKVWIPEFTLNRGLNECKATTHFKPEANKDKGHEIMNNYLSGKISTVTLCNHTKIAFLRHVTKDIKLNNVEILGKMPKIIEKAEISLPGFLKIISMNIVYAKLHLRNPFSAKLTILHIEANIFTENNVEIGSINEELKIVIEGNEKIVKEGLQLKYKPENVLESLALIVGDLKVNVRSKITLKVGKYKTNVNYGEYNINIFFLNVFGELEFSQEIYI